ncbi:MAG TPA: hypothetical protein VMR70_16025 [Flavisolibacter sp.]|nr:hypothetical protein [Flavisolibacter sp.]
MKQVLSLLLSFFFFACETKVNTATDDKQASTDTTIATKSSANILHTISLQQSGGLKVRQAFLTFEDGSLLPKSQQVRRGQTVLLHLVIEEGWTIRNGKASVDASERITTDQDQLVLNEPSLFQHQPTMAAKDANRIVLKATITNTGEKVNYFVVHYRVWDRWSNAEVKGSYRLTLAETAN